jgi:hypothetical protein
MFYLVTLTTASSGTTNRTLTPYEDKNTALRKFHEAFNGIGAGPKRITAILLEDIETKRIDTLTPLEEGEDDSVRTITTYDTIVVRNETWVLEETESE